MPLKSKKKSGGASVGLFKPTYFTVKIKIDPTGETYPLKIYNEMLIKELKGQLEFLTGLPVHIQRLWYLDEGDLQAETDIRHNKIVPDGLLHVDVRYTWYKIIEAVFTNNMEELIEQGVTPNTDFTSPNLEYLGRWHPKGKKEAINDRSLVALYMAAHRGRLSIVTKLIQCGCDVNAMTPHRRTALHVAAARGHGDVMDVLLARGAVADKADLDGETPSSIAIKHGHKDCDRHLFMFRWQQRAKQTMKNKMVANN